MALRAETRDVDRRLAAFTTPPLDRVRIEQFTRAMRDSNPVHADESFCRSLGLPTVIAPAGMAVVALSHAVARHYGAESIREIDVTLRSPVALGERLICTPEVVQITDELVELHCSATNEAGELRADGRIVVSIPCGGSTS
jgi:acyl dehydratase